MSRDSALNRLSVLCLGLLLSGAISPARADVKLPAIFGSHMVLQQGQKDRVWGSAAPGEEVSVSIGDQTKTAAADKDGKWTVTLDPLPVGGPLTMTVKGKNTITFDDVLVGEVWICSGQSNMQFSLSASYDGDIEALAAKFPKIRLISVPQVGTQEPQNDFKGQWQVCTPDTARDFSAVGYYFGRQLQETLDVPVGLIDDSWGGSACEAWINRERLAEDEKYKPLLARWEATEKRYPQDKGDYETKLAAWKEAVEKAKAEGKKPPGQPGNPDGQMYGNSRPGNIYNGVLKPTIGYGIRGAIWYQGESNANRAYQYRDLFPFMIKNWRDEWGIGDFSFYWVQLADFGGLTPARGDSAWPEVRAPQTMTMSKLPNTGEAVIIDVGEGKDIHPRNKKDVALRLARWALARDYGVKIPYQSPTYKSMEKNGNKITLTFDHVGGGLQTFDVAEPRGFAIAANDGKFVWAKGRLVGNNKVEVWSDEISDPVAVRYAWADNPVCNLFSREHLPVTPFRTDDRPGVTINNNQ
jgi:sialate O-acetylesterase